MKRGYLQISFTWLFAIIAGAFILFIAIFMTLKLIGTEQVAQDLKSGKEIGVLLNPVEIGFESAKSTSITMPVETRITARCENDNKFGEQIINLSQKSFGKWTETNTEVRFPNKYIFSENPEGKTFYIFAKPFALGFKVADLIYMTSSEKEYCFKNAPDKIKNEIEFLNQKNLVTENCQADSIKICFSGSCDIEVNYHAKYVRKAESKMYFSDDALMYAAIFSDSKNYECQVKRLMQRVANLALLYKDKADFISIRGCNSNLNLLGLENAAKSLSSSANLNLVSSIAEEIDDQNKFAECRLW
ncbi:hypothetical protein KAT80_03150 [Candidatus Pacearchaeota archaeon]|nr:hypothetical protein [Candidatus Pacearchaeota archaeon]